MTRKSGAGLGALALLFSSLCLRPASALPPVEGLAFLGAAEREAILSGGGSSEAAQDLAALSFWKGAPFQKDLLALVGTMPMTLAADSWTLIPLPEAEGSALEVFRAFTAFSTMKGLKTKSAIFPGDEDFILDSYRVDSAMTRRRLPDPEVETAPASATYTLYGKDLLAGEVYYELRFVAAPAWYRVTLVNLTTMRSLLLTLAEPGELATVFYILPADGAVLLYGLTLAKTPLVPGTVGLERTMLANRMMAIGKCFAANLRAMED
ncbi:MAG TPA: DUF6675 family protein [Rectinemataceae bacterium]|nr:DUF6675 family protein [Rectinemataceae bacterium]